MDDIFQWKLGNVLLQFLKSQSLFSIYKRCRLVKPLKFIFKIRFDKFLTLGSIRHKCFRLASEVRAEGGLIPLDFEIWKLPIKCSAKMWFSEFRVGKLKFRHFWPPWKIFLVTPGKKHYCPPLEKRTFLTSMVLGTDWCFIYGVTSTGRFGLCPETDFSECRNTYVSDLISFSKNAPFDVEPFVSKFYLLYRHVFDKLQKFTLLMVSLMIILAKGKVKKLAKMKEIWRNLTLKVWMTFLTSL